MQTRDGGTSAWHVIATNDEAPALVETVLELDPDDEYTKTELSDEAGVALKSLYLDGTIESIVDLGLLEKRDREGEEPLYSIAAESEVFEAAAAFDAAARTPHADSG